MRSLWIVVFVLLGSVASAQAPTRANAAQLLIDARAELLAAREALEKSDVWIRYQRAQRNAEDRLAAAKAAEQPKPETGSK